MAASVELLKAARAKIADPANWVQRKWAVDKRGYSVDPEHSLACRWCAVGALEACGGTLEEIELLGTIARKHFNAAGSATVNDRIGHSAVLRLYDLAIAEAINA